MKAGQGEVGQRDSTKDKKDPAEITVARWKQKPRATVKACSRRRIVETEKKTDQKNRKAPVSTQKVAIRQASRHEKSGSNRRRVCGGKGDDRGMNWE